MKPILFNTETLRAILEGRKTVTRRVVNPQTSMPYCHEVDGEWFWTSKDADDDMMDWWPSYETGLRPPYRTGDILYVRETWAPVDGGGYIYRAGFGSDKPLWRPSIHMPREAARIFLRVTDVRVERLRDITEEQAISEGCSGVFIGNGETLGSGWEVTPTDEFSKLWNSTIKPADRAVYSWEANPWVWVIELEKIPKPV